MYLALAKQQFAAWRIRTWRTAMRRSGTVILLLLATISMGFAFAWREYKRGDFARWKAEIKQAPVPQAASPQPGGQDAITLQRAAIGGGSMPEFLSATVLPGRGMNVLQITAFVPSRGEVRLLAAPPLAEAASLMTGTGADAEGAVSMAMGAAIEAPWAGKIFRMPVSESNSFKKVDTLRVQAVPASAGGLLLRQAATSFKTNAMPDGGEVEAVYDAGSFGERWPSQMEISTSLQLSSRAMEMKIIARNTGDKPQPVGIGWKPRFAVPNGARSSLRLRLPSSTRTEVRDRQTGQPSGRLLPVARTEYDFTGRTGAALGPWSLDDTYVHLQQAPLDNGPVAELLDPANRYGLRITMLSTAIRAVHVTAPANSGFVTIDPRFNYDDPLGDEWSHSEDTGMVVLQPGAVAQWRIRLEIFALAPARGDRM